MQLIVGLQRFGNACHRRRIPLIPRLVEIFLRLLFGCSIPSRADIAPTVLFGHGGLGVVINGDSRVGAGCQIGVHVVLGGRGGEAGAPVLEDNVIVSAGAKILGSVTVGTGSVIAANSVVLSDIPAASLAAGMPAQVKRAGIAFNDYL